MNKNDTKVIEITDITDTGNGIGRVDNVVVFVPNTAVGDVVEAVIIKVNKTYCVGKLLNVINPSKDRIEPDCECFLKCGGCCFRHISYESELSLKQKRVEDCIRRIAKIDMSPNPIVTDGIFNRYRNKAQFPVSQNGDVGFFAPHSHRIIPVTDCLLQPEVFASAAVALKKWMTDYGIKHYDGDTNTGLIKHLYIRSNKDESEIMVVIVVNGDKVPHGDILITLLKEQLGNRLKSVYLNVNTRNNNVVLGKKNILLYGKKHISDTICNISVKLSPNSFYQVNRNMAELLYKKAKEYAKPDGKILLDLYCGTGTIGLTMVRDCKKLIGVEIVEDAVKDALENATENGINNAEFICADALAAALMLADKKIKPDVVILDPPRKGCDKELIDVVANSFSPERVVYVSCDPATLARDIALFGEYGYKLQEYTPFDLFPRTAHVESVVLMSRAGL